MSRLTAITVPGSFTGSGRNNKLSVRLKMAALAPMPNASDKAAMAVNPGLRKIKIALNRYRVQTLAPIA